eukprot:2704024-Amphidinium_carterae.1
MHLITPRRRRELSWTFSLVLRVVTSTTQWILKLWDGDQAIFEHHVKDSSSTAAIVNPGNLPEHKNGEAR